MLCFCFWVTCLMIQPQEPECSRPFQLSLLKTPIPMSSPTHAHTHTHTRTRPHACSRAHTLLVKADGAFQGGVSLQTVSSTWRNDWRCTPFLTTLGTHCISRSGPRSPTRSAYSPASPLSPWLLAPRHTHTQSRPSDRPLQHQGTTSTPTRTYSSGVCLFSSDGLGVCV